MKKYTWIAVITLGVFLLGPQAAFAGKKKGGGKKDGFAAADTDGNGTVSLAEFQAAKPGATEEEFKTLDKDAGGGLSKEEYDAGAKGKGKGKKKANAGGGDAVEQ